MDPTLLLVSGVGDAQGARGAAGALACAASSPDQAAVLVDLGARHSRPTLISSIAASKLEDAIAGLSSEYAPTARGQLCHLALPPESRSLAALALVAETHLQDSCLVTHLSHELLLAVVHERVLQPDGVLLRADLPSDRKLVAKTIRDLMRADVPVAILGRRLSWIAERRALFGVLPADAPGGLSGEVVSRLLPAFHG